MSNLKAVILAGGKGTRLRPYTVVLPKPLMPVGDYPILEVIIKQLVPAGFNQITLAINHQAALFRTFFGEGEKFSKIFSLKLCCLFDADELSILELLSNFCKTF